MVEHYCSSNSRSLLNGSAVVFILYFLISLLFTKLLNDDHDGRTAMLVIMYMMISGLTLTIVGSLTFSNYSTKPRRISAMMLPARKSEKFIAHCMVYIVGGNLLILTSLILSDLLSAMIFGVKPMLSEISLSQIDQPSLLLLLGGLGYFLISQAIYVIGSAIWPAKSFLKTFVAISVVQLTFTVFFPFALMGNFGNFIYDLMHNFEAKIDKSTVLALGWFLVFVEYIILAGMYLLAWLRFKSLEVAKRFLN